MHPIVRIGLRLVLQFHRVGDAVNLIANIGHQLRSSMPMLAVIKQFVKLVKVSVEFRAMERMSDECCAALPDNASLASLTDNTVAGVREWVLDGARSEGHNGQPLFGKQVIVFETRLCVFVLLQTDSRMSAASMANKQLQEAVDGFKGCRRGAGGREGLPHR